MSIAEKLKIVQENMSKVYDAGYASGLTEDFNAGKEAQEQEFWDKYQDKGVIYNAVMMFAFGKWDDETFKPRHSMNIFTNAGNMFNTCGVTDLKGILERQGVVFDFSKATNFTTAFAYSKLTRLPTINTTSATVLNQTFRNSPSLQSIPLVLKDDGSQTFPNAFLNCTALTDLTIEGGKIGNDIDLKWSPLTVDSIESVIWALSGEVSVTGKTATFNLNAVNKAFETSEGANDGSTSDAWQTLAGGVGNWTIALATV